MDPFNKAADATTPSCLGPCVLFALSVKLGRDLVLSSTYEQDRLRQRTKSLNEKRPRAASNDGSVAVPKKLMQKMATDCQLPEGTIVNGTEIHHPNFSSLSQEGKRAIRQAQSRAKRAKHSKTT